MADFIAFIAFLWGLFVVLFLMHVGWRAMRALERLATSTELWESDRGGSS